MALDNDAQTAAGDRASLLQRHRIIPFSAAVAAGLASEESVAPQQQASVPLQQPDAALPQGWLRCLDYSNGGPMFLNHLGGKELTCYGDRVHALAVYLETPGGESNGAAAAVRCRVGQGVAVLCGTHPELHHRWLRKQDPPCVDAEAGGSGRQLMVEGDQGFLGSEAISLAGGQAEAGYTVLGACLEAQAAGRRALWNMLLFACLV